MRFPGASMFDSLDKRDRKLLAWVLSVATGLIVITAVLSPRARDESPVPSSYGTGIHGAKAAYLLLVRAGYQVQRWERPLPELGAPGTGPQTVLIIAEPLDFRDVGDKGEIQTVLDHGGRVLVTGWSGAHLLPVNHAEPNSAMIAETVCHTQAEGFDPLAQSGAVLMDAPAIWKPERPEDRVQFRCGRGAVVVTYKAGKSGTGQVVWWASSTPLENGSIERGNNLDLLLNTLGAPGDVQVIWDESLHGDIRGVWSYTSGTPVYLLWMQMALVGALLVVSYSRRSGPLRPLVEVTRRSPLEFVESLGALYRRAGASNTTVVIAYERFRHQLERRTGFSAADTQGSACQLAEAIGRRLHYNHPQLTADLEACEAASFEELKPRRALTLVQALHDHSVRLALGASSIGMATGEKA